MGGGWGGFTDPGRGHEPEASSLTRGGPGLLTDAGCGELDDAGAGFGGGEGARGAGSRSPAGSRSRAGRTLWRTPSNAHSQALAQGRRRADGQGRGRTKPGRLTDPGQGSLTRGRGSLTRGGPTPTNSRHRELAGAGARFGREVGRGGGGEGRERGRPGAEGVGAGRGAPRQLPPPPRPRRVLPAQQAQHVGAGQRAGMRVGGGGAGGQGQVGQPAGRPGGRPGRGTAPCCRYAASAGRRHGAAS